ncbi:sulfatase-like hydrolase/transferase [Lentibacter algarum]|uniref:sulfatase-like hydrolase/transferase n=1 Tax=Lentibacter algarum TaxID=576131 RepID=UPI001C09456A|nr:sulfatase-like hydrolase/transferase [Lentibacter algarum]MBU2983705.1 sulfatase-like hydrolase/transferase [Lentibacter algarum]
MNVLWIMCDQLRYDYLGCTGHPHIKTPNIDALANDGLLFSHAYAQSTICGPSRMSAYTGRYMRSHGSTTNASPLRVGEPTLGDHLADVDVAAVLIGKTHMTPDVEGMRHFGIEADSLIGVRTAECGFIPYHRDDGLHPATSNPDPDTDYFNHLRDNGLEADNPWEAFANSVEGEDGETLSGWFMRHAGKPAKVPAELSESAYLTDQAINFMDQAKGPWVAHVSYIKPHWPYIAPAPYHNMYSVDDVLPAVRTVAERHEKHPVIKAYQDERHSRAFSRDEVRDTVVPTYMGLISEVDTQIGRIISHLKENDQYYKTMIVFCSDHGDYLGDHWLGEKSLFHDPSVRIPFIVRDPRIEANVTRGQICNELVEMIDIAPTVLDLYNSEPKDHILEGQSLLPLLEGRNYQFTRSHVISESHYVEDRAGWSLNHPIQTSMARMVANRRWKLIHFEHANPILFDLEADPDELLNVALDPKNANILQELLDVLHTWSRNPKSNICTPYAYFEDYQELQRHYDECAMLGYKIGYWTEDEFKEEHRKRDVYRRGRSKIADQEG